MIFDVPNFVAKAPFLAGDFQHSRGMASQVKPHMDDL